MHRTLKGRRTNYPLQENILLEPAATATKDVAPSFSERLLVAHTVMSTVEGMTRSVVESDFDNTENKPQPPSMFVAKSSTDTRSEIERILADLGIVTKAEVQSIVGTPMTKWTSRLQLLIFNAVEPTLGNALQFSYSNLRKCLKTAMLNVIKQTLVEVVRSGRALTETKAGMFDLVQTKLAADIMISTVLSNRDSTVPIAEMVSKLVDRAKNEHHMYDLDRALTTTSSNYIYNERLLVRPERPLKALFDSESRKESCWTFHRRSRSSTRIHRDKLRFPRRYYGSDTKSDKYPKRRSRRNFK